MKDYLLSQLIVENNKKSFTSDIDQYWERYFRIENRKNKRLTSKIFPEAQDRKLYLKIFAAMRGKLRHGNQFDVASELSRFYSTAEKKGLFKVVENDWYYDIDIGTLKHETTENNVEKIHEVKIMRGAFLLEFGFLRPKYNYDFRFDLSYTMRKYFIASTPVAIVQMKKRLSRKSKLKKVVVSL